MACHLRTGSMLQSRNAAMPGQLSTSALSSRSFQKQLHLATLGPKAFIAQSRCIDKINAHARRECVMAAKSVEALEEGDSCVLYGTTH